jgi:hypothetical protein
MKRWTSNTYKLIPSKQSRIDSHAPMFFVPALPVRLEQEHGDLHYAMVDATAEISVAHRSLLTNVKHYKKTYDHYLLRGSTSRSKEAEIILISLFLCTPIGEPWLEFHDVPFALIDQNLTEHQRLFLGHDSFLSKLRLSLDFPRKEVRVSAPVEFEILVAKSTKHYLPSSIMEAENLISMGSYKAALPMIVAGLEEILVTKFDEINHRKPISYLLEQNFLSNQTKSDLKKVVDLRNHAVHGFGLVPIEKKQAKMALRTIIRIIESILAFNT